MAPISNKTVLFMLTSFVAVSLITAFVFLASKQRRLLTTVRKLSNFSPPVNDDKPLNYSELNLYAQRGLCSQFPSLAYSILPHAIQKNNVNFFVEEDAAPRIAARLELLTSGDIQYSLNSVIVWSSKKPRDYISCTELDVLDAEIARKRPEEWSFVSQTTNGVRLHLAPLAITIQSGDSRKIVWTYASGWDAVALCPGSYADCELPAQLPAKGDSELTLARPHLRLLLCPNADLLVLETTSVGSKLKSSLQISACYKY